MLHELLVSLSGFPGSLFVETTPGCFTVVKDVPFIHPSESAMLDRLAQLISAHQTIVKFIRQNGLLLSSSSSSSKGRGKTTNSVVQRRVLKEGMYVKALCRGLDVVLEPYRCLLLELEDEALKNPHLPLSHVQKSLEEYHLLFPALVNLLEEIKERDVHGCLILDVVYKHKASGVPCVHEAMTIVMHVCHGVMFKQLSSWLLYGLLVDPHDEFFIQQRPEDAQFGDSYLLDGGFLLQPSLLPAYVPVCLAEKMGFVGESIQLLESRENKNCLSSTTSVRHEPIIPNKDRYVQAMMDLQEEKEFNLRSFEATIDEIRACVAEQLWKLVVEEVDLVGHLQIVKDFFLLGRGELFQAFIEQAGVYLQMQVSSTMEHNVNVAFQAAVHSVLPEDESLSEKFKLLLKSNDFPRRTPEGIEFVARGSNDIGWNNMSLNYDVPWPLHIVFTKTILEKYNVVFRFLMFVKRVQLDLQQCWTLQMQWKSQKRDKTFPMAWKLRNLMAFVVNNLQYYLQVDVLESQHSLLLEKIQNTHDFEAIKLAHEQFVVSLLAQAFLSTKTITKCIMEILELCISFCQQFMLAACLPPRLAESYPMHASTFTNKVAEMQKQFHLQSSLLFQILSSSQTYQASPFVAQLLMRLDFNQFFSSGQLGL